MEQRCKVETSLAPSPLLRLLGIAELVLITLFPNLGIGRATLAVLAEHMFVVVEMSVRPSVSSNMLHPQLLLRLPFLPL